MAERIVTSPNLTPKAAEFMISIHFLSDIISEVSLPKPEIQTKKFSLMG